MTPTSRRGGTVDCGVPDEAFSGTRWIRGCRVIPQRRLQGVTTCLPVRVRGPVVLTTTRIQQSSNSKRGRLDQPWLLEKPCTSWVVNSLINFFFVKSTSTCRNLADTHTHAHMHTHAHTHTQYHTRPEILVIKMNKRDVSRCILVLDTSFFVHFNDKYFRTEGVYFTTQLQIDFSRLMFWRRHASSQHRHQRRGMV